MLTAYDPRVILLITIDAYRHVALLTVQGKEFELTPIPLRTVRPFVLEELDLVEVAEEEGFDLKDQMEITKFLKARVSRSSPFFACDYGLTVRLGERTDRAGERAMGRAECEGCYGRRGCTGAHAPPHPAQGR